MGGTHVVVAAPRGAVGRELIPPAIEGVAMRIDAEVKVFLETIGSWMESVNGREKAQIA